MILYFLENIGKYYSLDQVAVISRGYGRKSKGWKEVTVKDLASDSGDETTLIKRRFEAVRVFVSENRKIAFDQLGLVFPSCKFVLMDDGYQHLQIKAHKYLILTQSKNLFVKDWPLPMGLLREFACSAKHATAIAITKVTDATTSKGEVMQLRRYKKPIFSFQYVNEPFQNHTGILNKKEKIVVVSGIANPKIFENAVENEILHRYRYADHYNFSREQVEKWINLALKEGAKICTTEKDWMRIQPFVEEEEGDLFYISKITINIIDEDKIKFFDLFLKNNEIR